MTTGLVILIFLLDSLAPSLSSHSTPPQPWRYALLLSALVVCVGVLMEVLRRRLDRTGRVRNIALAERSLSLSRAMVVSLHGFAIVSLGWARSAAELSGSLPILREFVTALPPLAAFVAIYWSYAPIQRRIREALLWRHLHEGVPILADKSRPALVWEHVRHAILLGLIPLLLLTAWRVLGETVWRHGIRVPGVPADWVALFWQVAGVFVVLAFSPLILRFVWDTVPLEGGPLRDAVERVFRRNNVSAREVLVWQTSSGILNGALMGIIPRARYVLFTDALLQMLPLRQVEAVAAHEAGHGRLRHLPWILGATIASSVLGAMLFELVCSLFKVRESWEVNTAAVVASVGAGVFTLGWISRRFELQADAFAAKDLSRNPPEPESASTLVTPESSAAMIQALDTVSRLNGVPARRFTWRHGTVLGRQAHLQSIIGKPLGELPIDRTVHRLKIGTLLIAGACVLLLVYGLLSAEKDDTVSHAAHDFRASAHGHNCRSA